MPDQLRNHLLGKLRELWDEPTARQKITLPRVETMQLEGPDGNIPVIVPHPPQFQPAPTSLGGDLGKLIGEALKIAPSLQGRVGKVQYGTTPDIMDVIDQSNAAVWRDHNGTIFDPMTDFPRTGLLGLTNIRTGDISLNPRLDKNLYGKDTYQRPLQVLGHELTHAAGYDKEATADTGGDLFEQLLKRQSR